MTNDECPTCQAPLHIGFDKETRRTIKLSRARHLAHCAKRADTAAKNGKRSAVLDAHEKRLSIDSPCGAIRYMRGVNG